MSGQREQIKKAARRMTLAIGNKHTARLGFSILELLVVIGLIASVSGIAVMSLASITGAQEKPIERVFRDYVREARIIAATRKQVVYLSFNAARGEFILAHREGKTLEAELPDEDTIGPSEWEIQFYPKLSAVGGSGAFGASDTYVSVPVKQLVFHPNGIGTAARVTFKEEAGYESDLTLDAFSSGPDPSTFAKR